MENNKLYQKIKLIPSTRIIFVVLHCSFLTGCLQVQAQNRPDIFQKANNGVNRVSYLVSVFQPYLLKARQLYMDTRQMTSDIKNSAKSSFGKNNSGNNYPNTTGSNGSGMDPNNSSSGSYGNSANNYPNGNTNPPNNGNGSDPYNTSGGSYGNNSNNSSSGSYGNSSNNSSSGSYGNNTNNSSSGSYGNSANNNPYQGNNSLPNYLPGQSLTINNPATINNDATGNLGNQNNGLYGNCLDALTGTVSGMGDAAQNPKSVDLLFFAPADGQNTYYLMTPSFARNNSSAGAMTEHTSEQVSSWSDANESEIALTKLTLSQFNQIQNNGQISSAVRNAQNYSGYFAAVGQKLDGMVFGIKAQLEDREVYALMAIVKQVGTSGNNGYLKIKIKALGIDSNKDGMPDAMNYNR